MSRKSTGDSDMRVSAATIVAFFLGAFCGILATYAALQRQPAGAAQLAAPSLHANAVPQPRLASIPASAPGSSRAVPGGAEEVSPEEYVESNEEDPAAESGSAFEPTGFKEFIERVRVAIDDPRSPWRDAAEARKLLEEDAEIPDEDEEDAEARAARIEAIQKRFDKAHKRLSNFFAKEFDKSPDEETQFRVSAINDLGGDLLNMYERLRLTEDEDAQARIRENIAVARQDYNALVFEQQAEILRDVAARYGIQNERRQDQFIRTMMRLEGTPYFNESRIWPGNRRVPPIQQPVQQQKTL